MPDGRRAFVVGAVPMDLRDEAMARDGLRRRSFCFMKHHILLQHLSGHQVFYVLSVVIALYIWVQALLVNASEPCHVLQAGIFQVRMKVLD